MISIADRPQLKFRSTFANSLSVGGLAMLLLSIVLPYFKPEFGLIASLLMLGGMVIAFIGIYFANRWVRKPRPEESLDIALKKFPNSYRLYHYSDLPCNHILLSPYGVMLFHTINWEGTFTYKKGHWRELINFGRAIRYLLEQHLGNPTNSALKIEQGMQGFFKNLLGENDTLRIQSVIVFLHFKAKLDIENPPMPVCMVDALKKQIPSKGERLPEALYQQIQSALDERYPSQRELRV